MEAKENLRGSGILLSISSLPSPYGIGTLGREAYNFVDLLGDLKQKYWQVLPVGPTIFGDSPYQPSSGCAGNIYFIDLDKLVDEGLLEKEEILGITGAQTNQKLIMQHCIRTDARFYKKRLKDLIQMHKSFRIL